MSERRLSCNIQVQVFLFPKRDKKMSGKCGKLYFKCIGKGRMLFAISGYLTPPTCLTLRKHAYSNTLKILPPKNENFQIKNSDIFHVTGYRYMIHLYCLAVQADFYSDVIECRTLSPADRVRSPVGENVISIFSPVTFGTHRK